MRRQEPTLEGNTAQNAVPKLDTRLHVSLRLRPTQILPSPCDLIAREDAQEYTAVLLQMVSLQLETLVDM